MNSHQASAEAWRRAHHLDQVCWSRAGKRCLKDWQTTCGLCLPLLVDSQTEILFYSITVQPSVEYLNGVIIIQGSVQKHHESMKHMKGQNAVYSLCLSLLFRGSWQLQLLNSSMKPVSDWLIHFLFVLSDTTLSIECFKVSIAAHGELGHHGNKLFKVHSAIQILVQSGQNHSHLLRVFGSLLGNKGENDVNMMTSY